MTDRSDPFFSVLVPALNESRHIGSCLTSLLAQIPSGVGEVLLLDGGSSDNTVAVARTLAERNPALRVIPNPGRLQSVGCNLGSRLADPRSTILIRADAHALYPPDFIARCLAALRTSAATSVVVPMKTLGEQPIQRGIAAAQNSILGNGGSRHRRLGRSGFVDHGHHAAFDRDFFQALGGYDESFTHNEDAEFDIRAAAAGGRAWLCTEAAIGYFPRSTYRALARQYFRHGAGRARTLLKHRHRPRLRQVFPIGVLGAFICAAAGVVSLWFTLPLLAYLFVCTAWSVLAVARGGDLAMFAAAPALVTMHASWAAGFLRTCLAHRTERPVVARDTQSVRSFFTTAE